MSTGWVCPFCGANRGGPDGVSAFRNGDRVRGNRLFGTVVDSKPRFGAPGGNDRIAESDRRVNRKRIGVRWDSDRGNEVSYPYADLLIPC